jgi:hypothetical protein
MSKQLTDQQQTDLLLTLKTRFEKNSSMHKGLDWAKIEEKLKANPHKLWSLSQMEQTGGEPDVIEYDKQKDEYTFCDCAEQTPVGRRNFCYDRKAWEERKVAKPANNALDVATEMGVELLSVEEYHKLQDLVKVDTKTSSWLKTPAKVRALGGALFGDRRYDTVFIYHNGVQSYYAVRGFRGLLKV